MLSTEQRKLSSAKPVRGSASNEGPTGPGDLIASARAKLTGQMSISTKLLLSAGCAMALLLAGVVGVTTSRTSKLVSQISERAAEAEAKNAAEAVLADLSQADATVRAMADGIGGSYEAGMRDRGSLLGIMKPQVAASAMSVGVWFVGLPNFDGQDQAYRGRADVGATDKGLFLPYWTLRESRLVMEPIVSKEIYAEEYFATAAHSGRATLIDPYAYEAGGRSVLMTTISYPVRSHGKLIGVAGGDLSLDAVARKLSALRPLGVGRVMLLSGAGKWVSHPEADKLGHRYEDAGRDAVQRVLDGGGAEHVRGVKFGANAAERIIVPLALPSLHTTWAVVVDVPRSAILAPAKRLAQGMVLGSVFVVVALLAVLFGAVTVFLRRPLASLMRAVLRVSDGHYDEPVAGADRGDEVGAISRALDAFRHGLAEGGVLRAQQECLRADVEDERARHEAEKAEEAAKDRLAIDALANGLAALSRGDLTYRITVPFAPKTEPLKRDFNAAADQLQAAIGSVVTNVRSIHDGTSEISRAADDLSRRTEHQAASLEETAAALDQITVAISRTAVGARQTSKVVGLAKEDAHRSGNVVQNAVGAMSEIEQSAVQIQQIIGVIDAIAFQTNLLALNAGVEAARAGEAGRGFAVVASEVRGLAQRSAEAAREIKALISSSSSHVAAGVDLVDQAGAALVRIVERVAEIDGLINEIAASAQEQSVGLQQVNTMINQMDQVTQQNAAMVEQSTAASHSIAREADQLADSVATFEVGQGPAARFRQTLRSIEGGNPKGLRPRR